jgi:CO/xanthine dehydrogenase Mo-binding subunit
MATKADYRSLQRSDVTGLQVLLGSALTRDRTQHKRLWARLAVDGRDPKDVLFVVERRYNHPSPDDNQWEPVGSFVSLDDGIKLYNGMG